MSVMMQAKGLKEVYPYVKILLRIFLYTPASICSTRRFFSEPQQLKTVYVQ
jgi:hypothetical protein